METLQQSDGVEEKEKDDDEISLIDLFSVLVRYRWLIIALTAISAAGVVCFCIVSLLLPPDKSPLPDEYTPKALMLINDSSSGDSISSMISSSKLGSLAGMAGLSASAGPSYSSLAGYLAGTDTFFDALTDKFDLVRHYKIKEFPRTSCRNILKHKLSAGYDQESGIFTIKFTDSDPGFAQSVVNFAVSYLEQRFFDFGVDKNLLKKKNLEDSIESTYNAIVGLQKKIGNLEKSVSSGGIPGSVPSIMLDTSIYKLELSAQQNVYTQLKTQLEMTKIQMESETPVFQVIERAEIPERKSGPSRSSVCIIVIFAAFFMSVFMAFMFNTFDNIRKDPVAMAKISGRRRTDCEN